MRASAILLWAALAAGAVQAAMPIVAGPAPGETVRFAAGELSGYLQKLVPAAYPVVQAVPRSGPAVILVDLSRRGGIRVPAAVTSAAAQLHAPESFALVPQGDRLWIAGREAVGVLSGVYEFLERQGVRWYAPGELGEHIPQAARIELPRQAVTGEPAFLTRGFFAWEPRGTPEFRLWMARNRFNYWTAADAGHDFARTAGIRLGAGSHWVFETCLNPEDEYPFPKSGPDPYPRSTEASAGDANHDGRLTYFEAHPEWYGFVDGRRQAFRAERGANICSSNPHAMAELCRRIIGELAQGKWKDAAVLEFWPLDVGKWCECDACRRLGTPTDRLLVMVHQVRTAIRDALRQRRLAHDVQVFFPSYMETLPAPTRPLPEGFDYQNAIATFFPIKRCYIHSLGDPNCRETNQAIWETMLGWQKEPRHYRGQFLIGEYHNLSRTKSLPVLYTGILAKDIPLYRRMGATHFHYMHVTTAWQGPKRLNDYLLGKLLWDPGADVQALAERYYTDFYGPCAGLMRRFYERLEHGMSAVHQWKTEPRLGLVYRLNQDLHPLFPMRHLPYDPKRHEVDGGVSFSESLADLRECRRLIDAAMKQAAGPLLKRRLAEDERNLRYAEHTAGLYDAMARCLLARKSGDAAKAREIYRAGAAHARGLLDEREIVQSSASHANARDGLDASLVEKSWRKLGAELGVPPDEAAPPGTPVRIR